METRFLWMQRITLRKVTKLVLSKRMYFFTQSWSLIPKQVNGVPAAWLLTNTQGSYPFYLLLQDLKTKHEFKPSLICIDCSDIERKAIRAVFPNEKDHEILYCFFHLNRALKRKINDHISLKRSTNNFEMLLNKSIITPDVVEKRGDLQGCNDMPYQDTPVFSDEEFCAFLDSIESQTRGGLENNPIESLLHNPNDDLSVEKHIDEIRDIENFLAYNNFEIDGQIEDANNKDVKIEIPKAFPKTPDDINKVGELAAEGFYLIISSKSEEEANQRIDDYTAAFLEYPYYITYIQY